MHPQPSLHASSNDITILEPESPAERAMPWLSSLLLHAGLGLLAAFTAFAVTAAIAPPDEDAVAIVMPVAPGDLVERAGTPNLGTGDDPTTPTQNLLDLSTSGWDVHGTADSRSLTFDGGEAGQALTIAIGGGMTADGIGAGKGSGKGTGTGNGDGVPGYLARFGSKWNEGGIYGIPGAKRIVYVLDHSGSMMDSFDFLRTEVKRQVRKLTPMHQFSVIMFSEEVDILGPERLQRGKEDVITDVTRRLDNVVLKGRNDEALDPFQKALEKAVAMQPELIIFLTDGKFDPRLITALDRLNKDRKIRISTIAFVSDEAEYHKQLKALAETHGGAFRFVSARDLEQRQ